MVTSRNDNFPGSNLISVLCHNQFGDGDMKFSTDIFLFRFTSNTVQCIQYFAFSYSLTLDFNRYFVLLDYSFKSESIFKNLGHILRIPKLFLDVKFDQGLAELINDKV